MYNLDLNFGIVIILMLTVVVSFICLRMKIGSLQDKIKKLQKHLLYFNDMIEKHSETLKNLTSNTNALSSLPSHTSPSSAATTTEIIEVPPHTSPTSAVLPQTTPTFTNDDASHSQKRSELMVDFDIDLDDEKKDDNEKQEQSKREEESKAKTTNSSPLTSILPLVSTVMTIMNTSNNQPSIDNTPTTMDQPYIEEVMETQQSEDMISQKKILEDEIQAELKILDDSVHEKREHIST